MAIFLGSPWPTAGAVRGCLPYFRYGAWLRRCVGECGATLQTGGITGSVYRTIMDKLSTSKVQYLDFSLGTIWHVSTFAKKLHVESDGGLLWMF